MTSEGCKPSTSLTGGSFSFTVYNLPARKFSGIKSFIKFHAACRQDASEKIREAVSNL